MRNRLTSRAALTLVGAAGMLAIGQAAAEAANLLVNPGFESPTDLASTESTTINGWTPVGPGRRAVFQNHTPGGRWGIWSRTFEPAGGVFQDVTGLTGGGTYNLSAFLYFETNYN